MFKFAKHIVPKRTNNLSIRKIKPKCKSPSRIPKNFAQKLNNRYPCSKCPETDYFSKSNINKTRDALRKDIISQMFWWEKRTAEDHLDKTKLMLLTTNVFPIKVVYEYYPTDSGMLFIIQNLTDMGYTVSNIKYSGEKDAFRTTFTTIEINM
jgi:hypothetical protein